MLTKIITYRDLYVMRGVARLQFTFESQHRVRNVFIAQQQNVVLGWINNRFTVTVLLDVSILQRTR
jgi:hypothetical protein